MHVEIELFGGPQDGRLIMLPADSGGVPLSPLPLPHPADEPGDASAPNPVSWYELDHRREHGTWIYRYTTAHCARTTEV